jgi:hypothetical protein
MAIIILLHFYVIQVRLIETGYDSGLFVEGTQILASAHVVDPKLWRSHMSKGRKDIDKMLKGLIGVTQHLAYDYGKLPKFVERWRSLPNTDNCIDAKDDDQSQLYKFRDPKNTSFWHCTGINFLKEFNTDGSNIAPFTVYAYDAVLLLAAGFQYLVSNWNKTKTEVENLFNTDDLQLALITVSDVDGYTGPINIRTGNK